MTGKQKDAEFKVRYEQAGAHVHCALFSRYVGQSTWAKCGDFVIRENEYAALVAAAPHVKFYDRTEGPF